MKFFDKSLASAAIVATLALASCIKNDIPYPRIHANFTEFEVEGSYRASKIDSTDCVVTVYLKENVDPAAVSVMSWKVNHPSMVSIEGPSLSLPLSLIEPAQFTLTYYQDYVWTVEAVQPIERYFTTSPQIGQANIDVETRTVTVTLPETVNLEAVRVTSMKLGPEGSVATPDLQGTIANLTEPLSVEIKNFGRTETWTVRAVTTAATITTAQAEGWTRVAWVSGNVEVGRPYGVQYRVAGTDAWLDVPATDIALSDGDFTACIKHLSPLTTYEARAVSGSDIAEVITFTTGAELQVPGADFDNWWLDGKVWCPWAEGGEPYWGTGNKGATTLGPSNSTPSDYTPTGMGKSASLESKFVGVGALGKLAAGNIFTGVYVKTIGTNGELAFGREFAERPTGLTASVQYTSVPISHTSSHLKELKGEPDTCVVWMALVDSEEPLTIRTSSNPATGIYFDENDPCVIAYGRYQSAETNDGYISINVPLSYRSLTRKPRYIIIVASASKYGDYFTGGSGSKLYVDDINLTYDY